MLLLQEAAEGTASPLSGPLQETAEGSETGERAAKIRKACPIPAFLFLANGSRMQQAVHRL